MDLRIGNYKKKKKKREMEVPDLTRFKKRKKHNNIFLTMKKKHYKFINLGIFYVVYLYNNDNILARNG